MSSSHLARAVAAAVIAVVVLAGCASRGQLRPADAERIAGRTYVVTGASSGFGRGVALELGRHRANVVLAARRAPVLEAVAEEVRAAGGVPLVVPTDVADALAVQALADAAVARFGRIDAWINNAGVVAIGRFQDVPPADQARLVDVNLTGTIHGSQVALRQFLAQGAGTLVNLGSVESEVPLAYHATYSATKAGILALGRALNEELRLQDAGAIRVATVLPWAADTPIWEHAANYSGGTPRMAAMDGPGKVVRAIVIASLHPREEISVGWKAKGAYATHRIAPNLVERLAADIAHHWQIETAPPAPPTSGTLHVPVEGGTGVEGGARARIEREDAARDGRAVPQP